MVNATRVDGVSIGVVSALVVGLILCDYIFVGYFVVDVFIHFLGR